MSRIDDITRTFLRFLYEDSHFRPVTDTFLTGPRAVVGGLPVSREEFAQVLARLRGRELIAVSTDAVDGIPRRVGLTGSGLICAGEHGGDVGAWWAAAPARVAVLEPPEAVELPEVTSAPTPVIVAARTRPHRPTTSGLARVTRVLLLTLPSVERDREHCAQLRQAAEEMLEAIGSQDGQQEILRLAQRLRAELSTGPVAHTLGVVLLDGLDDAIRDCGRHAVPLVSRPVGLTPHALRAPHEVTPPRPTRGERHLAP